jgi:mannose/fructose/N-acetylgalactosamine-specific phosphotransferase system component IIB
MRTSLFLRGARGIMAARTEDAMPLCWVRVDDRLIHGQVVVTWRHHLRCDAIHVVDDAAAGDPYLHDALRLAAPAGLAVEVHTIGEAVDVLTASLPGRVLLLVKDPRTALALVEGGVAISHLNVGNLAAASGSRRVVGAISLTPEHAAALDALAARGVRITFQAIPDDLALDWSAVRRRL